MARTILQCTDSKQLHEIAKKIDKLNIKWDKYTFLCDLFELSAIAISNQTDIFHDKQWNEREERYKTIMNKYEKEDRFVIVEIFSMIFKLLSEMPENGFDDHLGKLYMMSGTSNSQTGQFFTPFDVSRMCAEVTIDEVKVKECQEKDEILTILEPTCGSGGMVLAGLSVLWNKYKFNYTQNVLVHCGDIDKRCVHMAYMQLSLAGVPAVIKHQNALTLETWDEWHTPALKMQWLRFRHLTK